MFRPECLDTLLDTGLSSALLRAEDKPVEIKQQSSRSSHHNTATAASGQDVEVTRKQNQSDVHADDSPLSSAGVQAKRMMRRIQGTAVSACVVDVFEEADMSSLVLVHLDISELHVAALVSAAFNRVIVSEAFAKQRFLRQFELPYTPQHVEVLPSQISGSGLFATKDLPSDEFVCAYRGEVDHDDNPQTAKELFEQLVRASAGGHTRVSGSIR